MKWNKHSTLDGQHAFLGASKYHWLNYDDEKLTNSYVAFQNTLRGTILHEYAAQSIRLGHKQQRTKNTLNMYINDAIGFKMKPEQVLYYSPNCFGTADSISFRDNLLRIHDYKSGVTPASMKQLYIYAALFCLEYGIEPKDITIELRIYQNNEIIKDSPDFKDILSIMDKIKRFDKILNDMKSEMEE